VSGSPAAAPVVLVTGAGGFLGRHCLRALLGRGFDVHAVGRTAPGDPRVGFSPVDLHDAPAVAAVIRGVRATHLLHLAWEVTPGKFWQSPNNLDWVAGTALLVRAFAEAGGRHAVFAGSCVEYDWSVGGVYTEDSPSASRTLYGVCKDATRRVVQSYCGNAGVRWAWGRVFFPYGPGEPADKLVTATIRALKAGRPTRSSAGTQVRDFIHAADAAEAFAVLVDSSVQGIVNVGTGVGTAVADVIRTLGRIAGRPDLVRLGDLPTNPSEPATLVADARRLTGELAWKARFNIADGLRDTFDSSAENPS